MREQWLRRLLSNSLLESSRVLEPFARTEVETAAVNGQTMILIIDQTDLSNRFAVLMLAMRVGDRSLPLAWWVEAGTANIGFTGQQVVLERVRAWLPAGAPVLLLADRFYPAAELFEWLPRHGWQYRLRVQGNLTVDTGDRETTTGVLAQNVTERYLPNIQLLRRGIRTHLGILREAGHAEPWSIAMDCQPTQAAIREYGARWAIEPTFSDFKRRGFQLEDTQLQAPDRLDRLLLVMTLAMYWCVGAGRHDALYHPTARDKKPRRRPTPTIGASKRPGVVSSPGSNALYGYC